MLPEDQNVEPWRQAFTSDFPDGTSEERIIDARPDLDPQSSLTPEPEPAFAPALPACDTPLHASVQSTERAIVAACDAVGYLYDPDLEPLHFQITHETSLIMRLIEWSMMYAGNRFAYAHLVEANEFLEANIHDSLGSDSIERGVEVYLGVRRKSDIDALASNRHAIAQMNMRLEEQIIPSLRATCEQLVKTPTSPVYPKEGLNV